MGSLADAANQLPRTKLSLVEVLDALDDDDRTAIDSLLADRKYAHTQIAELLTDHGYPTDPGAVRRYRKMRYG